MGGDHRFIRKRVGKSGEFSSYTATGHFTEDGVKIIQ